MKKRNFHIDCKSKLIFCYVSKRIRTALEKLRGAQLAKKLYGIVSVISTLSIFAGILLYVFGKLTSNNQSDNDLIMNQIRNEVGEANIISIDVADIHGFGNNSIIITAINDYSSNGVGELLILDVINNRLLSTMNDFLGIKSSYRTTFSHLLSAEGIGLYPCDVKVLNLSDDASKEIMVAYEVFGSTFGARYPAIYKYSYEKTRYELFGTLPIPHYEDNRNYDENGLVAGYEVYYEKTPVNGFTLSDSLDIIHVDSLSDGEREYSLPLYSDYCNYFWGKIKIFDNDCLIVAYVAPNHEEFYLNTYIPSIKGDVLEWGMVDSIKNTNLNRYSTVEDIQAVLDEYAVHEIVIEY